MIPIKQLFIYFLKQNNAYETFMFYFNIREDFRNRACPKICFFSKIEYTRYIDKAFTWDKTNKGWEYWSELNQKWINYATASEFYDFN